MHQEIASFPHNGSSLFCFVRGRCFCVGKTVEGRSCVDHPACKKLAVSQFTSPKLTKADGEAALCHNEHVMSMLKQLESNVELRQMEKRLAF